MASFLTFLFIFFWHGVYFFVFIWSVLNFICLYIERIAKHFAKLFGTKLEKRFDCYNLHRLEAFLGTQIFIPSALSNFYFFGGMDVGNVFMRRTYGSGDILGYLILTSCSYCIYNVSEVIRKFKETRLKNY